MIGYIHVEAFVSASTLAAVLALCVVILMTAIFAQIRVKKRLQTQLASYKTTVTVKYNVASESKFADADLDTKKNVAYESNPTAVNPTRNVAYESSTTFVDTNENISHTVSSLLK